MALVIEDGTGVDGADSFNTVEECSAHAVAYFGHSLSGSEADKEAALRRAWVVMSALAWKAGLWPTFGGSIPEAVKIAQSVFARAEFKSANALSPTVSVAGGKTLTKVDGIEWTPNAMGLDPEKVALYSRPVVTMAFDLLKPYLAHNPALGGRTLGAWAV